MRGVLLLSTVAYKAYSLASPNKSHNNLGNKGFSPTQSKKRDFVLPTVLKMDYNEVHFVYSFKFIGRIGEKKEKKVRNVGNC